MTLTISLDVGNDQYSCSWRESRLHGLILQYPGRQQEAADKDVDSKDKEDNPKGTESLPLMTSPILV